MPLKFSVCIEMVFSDLPLEERPRAVAEAGLPAIEFWGWRSKNLDSLRQACEDAGVEIAGFVCEAPGSLVNPADRSGWLEGAQESIDKAAEIGVGTLIVTTGNEIEGLSRWAQHDSIVNGLRAIAPYAEEKGVTLVLEPLNILVDHKGYYLSSSAEGFDIVRAVESPAVRLLYDIYHQQITEGFLIPTIRENIELIGHFHVADVPGRYEPGTGEINYANVFAAIEQTGYDGWVGLEFRPSGDSAAAVAQVKSIAGL